MNKRIKELWNKAKVDLDEDFSSGRKSISIPKSYDEMMQEKFAELIVRECVEVCNGEATYDPQTLPYKPSKQFADAIKGHFGVEE